jgi:hypothetical protein
MICKLCQKYPPIPKLAPSPSRSPFPQDQTHEEILNSNSSATIVLQNLIRGRLCATTINIRCARGLFESCRVFADVGPPYVVECAGSEAVHAFAIVWADENVGEGGAGLEDEDCIRVATFCLPVAGAALVWVLVLF